MDTKESIVISLGGSIVIPELPDPEFIVAFRSLILEQIKNNRRFFITVGGGKTCRHYQDALSKTIDAKRDDLDWMGIYSTQLNAQLVRMSFGEIVPINIVTDPSTITSLSNDVIIGAGWKPGWSTDVDAVLTAKEIGAKKIINLSNIEYVYDKDPNTNPDAKKFENISWKEYRSFITSEWKPGLNSPFDPIASKSAEEAGIEVAIMNGRNIENLRNYLDGKEFIGTVIK